MLSSIGVSIIIFATYAPQYTDPNLFGFPMASWYDDEWFSNMQQEFQIMLVASWTDMLSRLVFAVGLLQCMGAIKDLLTTWTITASGPTDTISNKAVIPTGTEIDAKLGPKLDEMAGAMNDNPAGSVSDKLAKPSLSRLPLETIQSDKARKKKDWFHRAIHFIVHIGGPGLFVTWGFVLIAVHVTAESNHNKAQCSLNLKPWFSSKPGCSLVELNCRSLRSSGHDEVIGSVWDAFDPDRAAGIVIRHCAELVVPSKIQDYHHITSLKVYNSTVVGWDDDSALTSTKNPNLRTIFLIRTFTTTGQLPRGMLSPDFPSGVRNIYMSVTNFPTLPNDLDTRWPKRLMLSMEFSPVTSIPDVVVRLDPLSVSFAGTAISTVSTEIFELPHVDGILFGLTRVQELPRNVSSINPVIRAILLQYTNVTEFWSWMDHYAYFLQTFPGRAFNAFGTPYCRELLEIANGNRTAFSVSPKPDHSVLMDVSTPAKLAFVMRAIECSTPIPLSSFPLPLEDAKHAWT